MPNGEVINFEAGETPSGDEMGRLLFPKKNGSKTIVSDRLSKNSNTPTVKNNIQQVITNTNQREVIPVSDGNYAISEEGETTYLGQTESGEYIDPHTGEVYYTDTGGEPIINNGVTSKVVNIKGKENIQLGLPGLPQIHK